MSGLMTFHAHADDEVIQTGGVMAKYAARGDQVVVVTATDGAEGEIHNYDDPEAVKPILAEVRAKEVRAALDILGVEHHEFLGYRDSGMMGTEPNAHPNAFWQADFMEATERLIRLIRRYRPEVMVIYDPFGGYGHPDHINVHRVGIAAFSGTSDLGRFPLADGEEPWAPHKLYWTTWPRSRARQFAELRLEAGTIDREEYERLQQAGTPDEDIHAWIDVTAQVDQKIAALRAHRSQIPEDWFMLTIPDEAKPAEVPPVESDLFAGLR
jgi:N-acetyl-1-D-myo-inositol-2-amino-2-deoxy-alpha-D-glucopyranoside deacetylase